MTDQIFITVTQQGYTDSTTLLGPFSSVEEGKRKVTDCVERGIDGDETIYIFHKVTTCPINNTEVGYVFFTMNVKFRLKI